MALVEGGGPEPPGQGADQEADAGPAGWFAPPFLLEESKLRPPPSSGTVRRAALLDRLRTSPAPVLSVAAPLGYGKSALLHQWAEETPERVAWLSLEPEDNDPTVLLAYIATALNRLEPIDTDVFRTLAPPGTSVAALAARRIAAALSSMDGPVALVLDHTEVLHNDECRDAVAELALHLPPAARLAVASRGTPPVPLGTLRSRGAVVELGADDLAMDETEARVLLGGAGDWADAPDAPGAPEAPDLADLVRRTEGWPVGLYLAGLARRAGGPSPAAGFAFTGDDRLMADYLRTELLAGIPPRFASFLTRTSVLERMSGPLCDAVLDRTGSSRLLEELEGADLLVVPLDRRREWYRYHTLFRQLLRFELGQREGEVVAGLHSRASAWFETHGMADAAIVHAQASGDADRVAELVATHLLATYADGRVETVRRWCRWFDDGGLIDRYPAIAVLGTIVQALTGQAGTAERWATAADRAPRRGTAPDGSSIESWRALMGAFMCRHGLDGMRRDVGLARDGLAPESRWRPTALLLEGVMWLLDGSPERGDPLLERAVELGLDIGALPVTAMALATRSVVAIRRGEWHEAEALAERGLTIVERGHLDDYVLSAPVYAVVARTAAHRGDAARAREILRCATRLRPQLTYALPFCSVQTLLELARTYLALADTAGARVVLREARDILRVRPDLGTLPQEAAELRATLASLGAGQVGASSLTKAELRLIPLLSTHLSFREIGERLYLSRHTVKSQAISVYRKLGVTSRSEAIDRVGAIGMLGG